ncbi:hypothetical protein AAVH_22911 [Aphelenchoides avenae]|nr:hypothetical protein AAVH_22911 [Aphelenchus avenae]
MLPLELLNVIFGALSRDDLDTLMLTNVLFRDIVLHDFAEEPLRYFEELTIYDYESYRFNFLAGDTYYTEDNDDFTQSMRLGRVGKVVFEDSFFCEELFEMLLPLKDAWRLARLETPCNFRSHSVLQRAFSELFFCRDMRLFTNLVGKLREPFVSFPPVRECASLFLRTPNPVTVAELVEWLNLDAHSKGPKELHVADSGLDGGVENFVQLLKMDFFESKTARRYMVKVHQCAAYDRQPGRFLNKDTSEVMSISLCETDVADRIVAVERKPMDDKQ